jgi:sirohydrochlorin ferrochelatase
MTGFIVFAHGSRIESANQAVRDVASRMAASRMAASGEHTVEPAFLELGEPNLSGAIQRLRSAGVSRIVVIPYFLTLGMHLERDLPRLVREAAVSFGEGIQIEVTPPLDGHPALLEALLDRASQALAEESHPA